MTHLSLLDALVLLFLAWRISRAGKLGLGNSLHGLIALILIVALFLGLRIAAGLRELLSDMAGFINTVPGLGSRLLIVLAAWYLMRLLRERLGEWLESLTPPSRRVGLARLSEALRAVLLCALLIWLIEGWLAPTGPDTGLAVSWVRAADVWVVENLGP